jgi:hypothetical protein
LGRIRRQQRSEHRREILCATWFHAHTHTDGNCDSFCYANRYCHTYAYFDAQADTHAEEPVNAQGSSYPAAAPVTFHCEKETDCSIWLV